MPIPKPEPRERLSDFMNRCMGNPTMVKEYERDQRAAICRTEFEKAKKKK